MTNMTPSPELVERAVEHARLYGTKEGDPRRQFTVAQMEIAIRAAIEATHLEEVVRALTKCRDKFLHYEDLHRLKCTAEGDEKADRNREMADMCDAALTLFEVRKSEGT
jgi:succinylarginine dihydrolase